MITKTSSDAIFVTDVPLGMSGEGRCGREGDGLRLSLDESPERFFFRAILVGPWGGIARNYTTRFACPCNRKNVGGRAAVSATLETPVLFDFRKPPVTLV